MINIINKTYEILFCMFFLENSPLLEIDQMINEAMGKDIQGDENDLLFDIEAAMEDIENGSSLKKYDIGRSFPGLKNFRLLSKAHAERLEENDIAIFERLINENSEDDLETAREIVKKTYKSVMCVNPAESERMTCLGPYPDVSFCFDDDAIVLGIVIDDPELPEMILTRLREIALNMKEQLFPDISDDLDAKIELYVSV